MTTRKTKPESPFQLLARAGVLLALGVAFYFGLRSESPALAAVALALVVLFAISQLITEVRERRQRALFGELPLQLATSIPRLGAQLVGAFEVTLAPDELDAAWVRLTCARVHPGSGDSDRFEEVLWSERAASTPVAVQGACKVEFVLQVPRGLPRSTYTPGMQVRDREVEFDEWSLQLELTTKRGRRAQHSKVITVYASE